MITTTFLIGTLLSFPCGLPCAPSAGVPVPSQEEEVADEREDIENLLDQLAGHVKKKGAEDEEAIAVIDQLYQAFPDCGPKDRSDIVKGLEKCFKSKRTKELEPGKPDDRLYQAATVALGGMGPESVKPLIGVLGHKTHKRNLRLQARIAKALGNTKDERGIKPLLGLLKDKDKEMQAAGAEALGSYENADLKARKEIFKDLLDTLIDQKTKKDGDVTDVEASDRWAAISGPIIASLQRLSGHDERSPEAWQRWWNKNKKADWDGEG